MTIISDAIYFHLEAFKDKLAATNTGVKQFYIERIERTGRSYDDFLKQINQGYLIPYGVVDNAINDFMET